jgi:hypothetical protein
MNNDIKMSFPLGLFCMATLSPSVLLALNPNAVASGVEKPLPVAPKKDQKADDDATVYYLPCGLDDDLYWSIGKSELPLYLRS